MSGLEELENEFKTATPDEKVRFLIFLSRWKRNKAKKSSEASDVSIT